MDEIKEKVFSMSPTSSAGPDGMNEYFFHKTWHIIKRIYLRSFKLFLVFKGYLNISLILVLFFFLKYPILLSLLSLDLLA